jgi:hypothetical protein
MKIRFACLNVFLAIFVFPGFVAAQKMEAPKDREPGDRAVFNYTLNNKTIVMEENWTALTAEGMVGVEKFGGQEYEIVMSRSPEYHLRKGVCWGAGKGCTFSPPLNFVDFPLEKGKKWSNTFTVTGETFTAEVTEDRVVERIETVKVPSGEFEAYKITSSGRFRSKDSKGTVYTGKEEGTIWVASVSGKMITVKILYKNSFGDRATLEMISTNFK